MGISSYRLYVELKQPSSEYTHKQYLQAEMNHKHVLFIMPDIRAGGVGKMRLNIIESFVSRGVKCTLVLRKKSGELLERAESLCDVVEISPNNILQFVPNLTKLIRNIKPTNIVTCFQDVGFLTWLSIKLSRTELEWTHSIHATISRHSYGTSIKERIKHYINNILLLNFVADRCNNLIVVSEGIKAELGLLNKSAMRKSVVIYNPVVDDKDISSICPSIEHNRPRNNNINLVSVGRLNKQKGFDILIKAMALLEPTYTLQIFGDGEEKKALDALINMNNLDDRVFLRGYTDNPISEIKKCDVFVLSSYSEGFGNVLVEALSCGVQVISTDCPVGPREILNNGEYGQLVPVGNELLLAEAIKKHSDTKYGVHSSILANRAMDFTRTSSVIKWYETIIKNKNYFPNTKNL